MTIVYNPPEEHKCLPPRSVDREIRIGAIWKCECGDLFELVYPELAFSYCIWKRLDRFWNWHLYREYKDK
ncbi:MAG: hypothetical protein PHW63_11855 [Alphaproteobacteria bacterium]|nr:hypothetical protein [Alphaproteobacteria bacterium]